MRADGHDVTDPLRSRPIHRHATTAVVDERDATRRVSDFDFRRPSKLGRDVLRVLELAHETFVRRLGSGWGSELRSVVQVEPLGMEQVAYDVHIRSMPTPNVVLAVRVPPLPGAILVDMNVQLAVQMVERLLGAAPRRDLPGSRRPSEVESDLIRHLGTQAVAALAETLAPLVDVAPELVDLEFNPQLVQVAAPSDTVLLLSHRVTTSQGLDTTGILTVAYPAPVLTPLLEAIDARRQGDEPDAALDARAHTAVATAVQDVPVAMDVRLNTTTVLASDIAALDVGDVLRLDHRVDAPAVGVVGDSPVLLGHLGRRGPRRAVQVGRWIAVPPLEPLEPLVVEATLQTPPRAGTDGESAQSAQTPPFPEENES